MAKASGTSLNDIVMAICAGALRRYLAEYDVRPDKPLVAGVPVSLREAGNTDPNNQVSMMLVSLATNVKDPLARLKAIHLSAAQGKKLQGSVKGVIPTDFPSLGVPWLMSGLASLYGRSRLANRLPPIANVAISNVPGPQFPLYFAGARLAHFFPVSIPGHGIALNITVQSYNGLLEVGLTGCRRALPDIDELGDHIVAEHRKLGEAIAAAVPAAVPAPPAAAALASVAPAPALAGATPAPRRRSPRAADGAAPRKRARAGDAAAAPRKRAAGGARAA